MFTTSKAGIFVKIKIIKFFAIIPIGGLIHVVVFLQKFAEFAGQQAKVFSITVIT